MKKTVLIVMLGALVTVSGFVVAEQVRDERKRGVKHQQGEHRGDFRELRALEKLDLTDSQKTQIQQLLEAHKAQREALKPTAAEREQAKAAFNTDVFDEAGIRENLARHNEKRAEQQLAALKLRYDIAQVLTEEQRQQLQAQAENRRSKERKRPESE